MASLRNAIIGELEIMWDLSAKRGRRTGWTTYGYENTTAGSLLRYLD